MDAMATAERDRCRDNSSCELVAPSRQAIGTRTAQVGRARREEPKRSPRLCEQLVSQRWRRRVARHDGKGKLAERLRHTHGMASQPSSRDRFSVAELTVHTAESDLLEVDPLDLGPDAPATAALEVERGPEPRDVRQRGE